MLLVVGLVQALCKYGFLLIGPKHFWVKKTSKIYARPAGPKLETEPFCFNAGTTLHYMQKHALLPLEIE